MTHLHQCSSTQAPTISSPMLLPLEPAATASSRWPILPSSLLLLPLFLLLFMLLLLPLVRVHLDYSPVLDLSNRQEGGGLSLPHRCLHLQLHRRLLSLPRRLGTTLHSFYRSVLLSFYGSISRVLLVIRSKHLMSSDSRLPGFTVLRVIDFYPCDVLCVAR